MKVLFIGNSFTYFNELQDLFQNLCAAAGHDVVARRRTVGGYGVEHHTAYDTEHGKAVLADLAEGWDYAVIQGQSSQPALNRGLFLEKSKVLAETIRENIAFGRELSDEEIKRAAKLAQAEDFIEELPEKYEHVIAPKGTNLSGGQRQRLLIARAVAAKPDIIILDDSSSALDYKTDAALRKALDTELSDSTVITVAQRVSSVKNCGEILVLDNGKIIGRGTHEELIENCPEYKEISDSQMGGAFVD